MAVSTSQYRLGREKGSIAEELAGQTEGLQKQPWWKTVGSIALPLLAPAAMGPLGGYLASMGGGLAGGGALASLLGGGLTGVGGALGAVGTAGTGSSLLKTLGQTGVKALYNLGTQAAGKGLLGSFDKRSEEDIKVGGGALRQALGKKAQEKLRGQYRKAKGAEKETGIAGSILSAFAQQGGMGAFKDAFKTTLGGGQAAAKGVIPMLEQLAGAGVDKSQQIAKTAEIMGGGQAGPLQQLMSGQKMITDPSLMGMTEPGIQAVGQQTGLQNLLGQQMGDLTGQYDFGTNLIKDASQRGGGLDSIAGRLGSQQGAADISQAASLFPNLLPPQSSSLMDLGDDTISQLLNAYYNYEDVPKVWE